MQKLVLVIALVLVSCAKENRREEKEKVIDVVDAGVEAKIYLDKYFIPHIKARSIENALFAFGYFVAKTRFVQLDLIRITATGRVSQIIDIPATRSADRKTIASLLTRRGELVNEKIWLAVKEKRPEIARAILSFTEGINLWVRKVFEGKEQVPREWREILRSFRSHETHGVQDFLFSPEDIIAIARFYAWYLAGDWLMNLELIHGKSPHFPKLLTARAGIDVFTAKAPLFVHTAVSLPKPSNNWVISAEIAEPGPIVANDPHLELMYPSMWIPVHILTPELEVKGFALAGLPVIAIGTNGSVAWAITNAGWDVLDIYIEDVRVDERCESGYLLTHSPETLDDDVCARKVVIRDMEFFTCEIHGVFFERIEGEGTHYAVRWVGQEVTQEVEAFWDMLFAKSVEEFAKAVRKTGTPATNWVFADTHKIGWGAFGLLPKRQWDLGKFNPAKPLPANGCCNWAGFWSPDVLPQAVGGDFWVTANSDPTGATADGNPFNDTPYILWSYDPGYRTAQITREISKTLQRKGKITPDDVKRIQHSTRSPVSQKLKEKLLEVFPTDNPLRDEIYLWQGTCPSGFVLADPENLEFSRLESAVSESRACLVFWVWLSFVIRGAFEDEFGEFLPYLEDYAVKNIYLAVEGKVEGDFWDDARTPEKEDMYYVFSSALEKALRFLQENLGDTSNWLWGNLAKVKFIHPLSLAGITLYDTEPFPSPLAPWSPSVAWINLAKAQSKDDFVFSGGPSLRFISYPKEGRFLVEFQFPGGVSSFDLSLAHTWFSLKYIKFPDSGDKAIVLR